MLCSGSPKHNGHHWVVLFPFIWTNNSSSPRIPVCVIIKENILHFVIYTIQRHTLQLKDGNFVPVFPTSFEVVLATSSHHRLKFT